MADAARTEAVIQGVTAPMVAVPGPGQALMARSAGFGGTMPGMTAKIALRGGNQDAFRRWIANRNDVITANGLDQLMDNGRQVVQEDQAGRRVTIRHHHGLPARRIVSKDGTSCWAPDQPAQRLICCCQRLYLTPRTQLTGAE